MSTAGASDAVAGRPRLCIVGPMLGRHPGWVTTQGEILVDRFAADGWEVRETSRQIGRAVRLVDTVACLVRWRRHIDVTVISVFSGMGFVMADLASLVARLLGLPVVLVLRGGNLPDFALAHPSWCRRVLRRAAVVVAPSPYLVPLADAVRDRVVVVPNVVDVEAFGAVTRTEGAARLLWMRTFHPIYNPVLAVEAFERVVVDHPEATLTMAGQDKGLLGEVRERVAGRPWAAAVAFPGFLGPPEKVAAFASHDVYLHTNHVDNTPVSVLEAAAAGVPVVATDVGGIADLLVHEETALIVPDGDADAFTAAVVRILEDPDLAGRLAANGRRLAAACGWSTVSAQWSAVFDRALGAPRPARETRP